MAQPADADMFAVEEGASQQDTLRALINGVRELVRVMPDGQIGGARQAIDANLQQQAGILERAGLQAARTVESRPLTTLPLPYGQEGNINAIRLNQLPEYGDEKKTSHEACLSWLDKIMDSARNAHLNEQACKDLLKAKATGLVYTSITQMARDGLSLSKMITTLEVQFAGVIPAVEAKTKCGRLEKDPKESVSTFALKLRKLAHIAARDEATPAQRAAMETELTATNLRRALPPSVKKDLEAREISRRDDGKPEWTLNELIVQAELMDSRRLDRMAQLQDMKGNKIRNNYQPIRQVEEEEEQAQAGDDEDDQFYAFLMEDVIEADEEVEAIIGLVKDAAKQGYKGKRMNNYVKSNMQKRGISRPTNQPYRPTGPPRLLREAAVPRNELPRLANVEQNQCLQCGLATNPPHKLKDLGCPLRDKELMDRPCVKCGHGLHQANDCVTAFQNDYKAEKPKNGQ